jgi:hypothetical protein
LDEVQTVAVAVVFPRLFGMDVVSWSDSPTASVSALAPFARPSAKAARGRPRRRARDVRARGEDRGQGEAADEGADHGAAPAVGVQRVFGNPTGVAASWDVR